LRTLLEETPRRILKSREKVIVWDVSEVREEGERKLNTW